MIVYSHLGYIKQFQKVTYLQMVFLYIFGKIKTQNIKMWNYIELFLISLLLYHSPSCWYMCYSNISAVIDSVIVYIFALPWPVIWKGLTCSRQFQSRSKNYSSWRGSECFVFKHNLFVLISFMLFSFTDWWSIHCVWHI